MYKQLFWLKIDIFEILFQKEERTPGDTHSLRRRCSGDIPELLRAWCSGSFLHPAEARR